MNIMNYFTLAEKKLYPLLSPKRQKLRAKAENIGELLTPVSLAYWIMDDGSFTGSGLKLHTNAFSEKELKLLIVALEKNFNLIATIQISNRENLQNTLYISKNQMSLVKKLVIEHMHPTMLYKLNISPSLQP